MTKQQRNLLFLLQYRTVAVITVIPGSLTVNRSHAPPNVMVTPTIWYFPPQRWLRDAQNVTLLQQNCSCVMVCPSPGGFGCKPPAGGWSWVRRCSPKSPSWCLLAHQCLFAGTALRGVGVLVSSTLRKIWGEPLHMSDDAILLRGRWSKGQLSKGYDLPGPLILLQQRGPPFPEGRSNFCAVTPCARSLSWWVLFVCFLLFNSRFWLWTMGWKSRAAIALFLARAGCRASGCKQKPRAGGFTRSRDLRGCGPLSPPRIYPGKGSALYRGHIQPSPKVSGPAGPQTLAWACRVSPRPREGCLSSPGPGSVCVGCPLHLRPTSLCQDRVGARPRCCSGYQVAGCCGGFLERSLDVLQESIYFCEVWDVTEAQGWKICALGCEW